jgi:hypothetical protein
MLVILLFFVQNDVYIIIELTAVPTYSDIDTLSANICSTVQQGVMQSSDGRQLVLI